ncbi:nucleotidyltransferase [Pseudonocardia eucalypti]|uniref:Nucleotidyltransferase n=1 Tax=Pseudonocardia eucalypti TaxID=648755 RepID=A0ABP9PYS1_9PSEU|nr:putative nucleotidyltransferase [Pseudonocardia eucalypti]
MAERRGARNVRVFGSVARAEDGQESDIDLLVDLDDGVGLISLAGLRRELTELLKVSVDVVPAAMLKPGVRVEVLAEAVPL